MGILTNLYSKLLPKKPNKFQSSFSHDSCRHLEISSLCFLIKRWVFLLFGYEKLCRTTYEINTFVCLVVEVTGFHLTLKWLITM